MAWWTDPDRIYGKGLMGKLPKEINVGLLKTIYRAAQIIINEAYLRTKRGEKKPYWKNQTWNLANSYGFAIYYNGEERARGYVSDKYIKEPQVMRGRKNKSGSKSRWYVANGKEWFNGREQIETYLNDMKDSELVGKRGFKVVFAVAMYYGEYLERKGYHLLMDAKMGIEREFTKLIGPEITKYMASPIVRSYLLAWTDGIAKNEFKRSHRKLK